MICVKIQQKYCYNTKKTLEFISFLNIIIKFALNAINKSEMKDLNRIKVVLIEKKRTNKGWLHR